MEYLSCDSLSINEKFRTTVIRQALQDVHIKGEWLSKKIKLKGTNTWSIQGIGTFPTSEGIQQDNSSQSVFHSPHFSILHYIRIIYT